MGKLASDYSAITTAQPLNTGSWWLKVVRDPAKNQAVKATPDFTMTKPVDAEAFYPEGDTRAIVVTAANVTKGWEFPVTFRTLTTSDRDTLMAILESGEVLLLQDVLPEQWYCKLVGEIERSRIHGQGSGSLPVGDYYTFTCQLVEVARPIDPPVDFTNPPPVVVDPDPAALPSPPQIMGVSEGDGQLGFFFSYNGADAVLEFEAISFPTPPGGQPAPFANAWAGTGVGGFTFTGLNNGQSYTLLMRARNIDGWGAYSQQFGPYTPKSPVSVARFMRDDSGLSWGTIGEWSVATQQSIIAKMCRDDKIATWARIDYYRNQGTQVLKDLVTRHLANGCTRMFVICNGASGGWLNTSDGMFPNASDEAAFRSQWRTLATEMRTHVGPDVIMCYGFGNEPSLTTTDGGSAPWAGASNIPRFSLGKYLRAYSWFYPEIMAGDSRALCGPGSGIHLYTAIPTGVTGRANYYSSPYKSEVPGSGYSTSNSAGHERWSNTDFAMDLAGAGTAARTFFDASLGTNVVAPTIITTGFHFLDGHFYTPEEGPLFRGNAIGVKDNQTVVNGLREAKYVFDEVRAMCITAGIVGTTADRICRAWCTEYGFPTAPYWGSGQVKVAGDVVVTPAGGLHGAVSYYTAKVNHTTATGNQPPNTAFWQAGVVDINPADATPGYNRGEMGLVRPENSAGQWWDETCKIWCGTINDADSVNIKDKVGVMMFYQPLDESEYWEFQYGMLYDNLQPKGSPSTSGSYDKYRNRAGDSRPSWFNYPHLTA